MNYADEVDGNENLDFSGGDGNGASELETLPPFRGLAAFEANTCDFGERPAE